MSPYLILYGAMLVLFGGGAVLCALLKRRGTLAWPLAGVFGTLHFLFIGLLGLDLTRVWAADLSPAAISYRWMLFPAAAIVLGTGVIVLGTYGDHLEGEHAAEYRAATAVSLGFALAALVGIVFQPLFA